jgi:hypothetical protein
MNSTEDNKQPRVFKMQRPSDTEDELNAAYWFGAPVCMVPKPPCAYWCHDLDAASDNMSTL